MILSVFLLFKNCLPNSSPNFFFILIHSDKFHGVSECFTLFTSGSYHIAVNNPRKSILTLALSLFYVLLSYFNTWSFLSSNSFSCIDFLIFIMEYTLFFYTPCPLKTWLIMALHVPLHLKTLSMFVPLTSTLSSIHTSSSGKYFSAFVYHFSFSMSCVYQIQQALFPQYVFQKFLLPLYDSMYKGSLCFQFFKSSKLLTVSVHYILSIPL